MFHIMLILPALIIMVVLAGIVLFGIFAVIAALVGGTTASMLAKNALVKKMLLIGFSVLFLIGLLCLIPLAGYFLSLPAMVYSIACGLICAGIVALCVVGINLASGIAHRIARPLLIAVFGVVLAAAIAVFGVVIW